MTTPIGEGPTPYLPIGEENPSNSFSLSASSGPELTEEEIAFFQQLQETVAAPLLAEGRFTINDLYLNIEAYLRDFLNRSKEADLAELLQNIDLTKMNAEVAILVKDQFDQGLQLFNKHQKLLDELSEARSALLAKSAEVQAAQAAYNLALVNFQAVQPDAINLARQQFLDEEISLEELNQAIALYNSQAAPLQNAASSLNQLIDEYNQAVADYNEAAGKLEEINQERAEKGILPPLNVPPEVAELAEGEKIPPIPLLSELEAGDPLFDPLDLSFLTLSTFIPVALLPIVPQISLDNYLFVPASLLLKSLSSQTDRLISSSNEFIDLDALLSIVLLRRGKVTAQEKLEISKVAQAVSPSNEAASMSSIVLGLGTPRLISALSTTLLTESYKSIFEQQNLPNLDRLLSNLKAAVVQTINTAATLNILASTQLAKNLLSKVGINSFPVTLALNVGLVNSLNALLGEGGFKNLAEGFVEAGGPNASLAALSTAAGSLFLFAASASQIGKLLGEERALLNSLALNLVLGLPVERLNLNLQAKRILRLLNPDEKRELFSELKEGLKAFLPKEVASEAARLLLTSRDPEKALGELLGSGREEDLARIKSAFQIGSFAVLLDVGDPLKDASSEFLRASFGERSPLLEEAAKLDTGLLGKIEFLRSRLGEEAGSFLKETLPLLSPLQAGDSLLLKLQGELGKSEAQALSKEFLHSINSTLNLQKRQIEQIAQEGDLRLAEAAVDSFRSFVVEETTQQSKILEKEINPAYTFVGLMYEGMGGTVKGKKDLDILGSGIPPGSMRTPA